MQQTRLQLQDGTEVTLTEQNDTVEFPYCIAVNGVVKCMYDTFDHAWEDLGKAVHYKKYSDVVAFL